MSVRPAAPPKAQRRSSERTADSSDEEQPSHTRDQRRTAGAQRFDKDKVLAAVKVVRQKMPSFLSEEDMSEWREWHEAVPTKLSEVSEAALPLPMGMPLKCGQAPPAVLPASREQKQLLTYRNPGGRGAPHSHRPTPPVLRSHFVRAATEYNAGQRGRDALQSLGLKR